MRRRLLSGTCDRCKEKIYGDNYGPLGHKCRPALEVWAVVSKRHKVIDTYEDKGSALLNAGEDDGERVVMLREVVPSFGDKL